MRLITEQTNQQEFTHKQRLSNEQETLSDGGCVVRFMNGDLKRVEGRTGVVVYTYAAARTTHTMHPSGLEVFEFPNGQVCLAVAYAYAVAEIILLFVSRVCLTWGGFGLCLVSGVCERERGGINLSFLVILVYVYISFLVYLVYSCVWVSFSSI